MNKVKEILSDTHGFLLWKEQKEKILVYIDSLSDEEKERYNSAIKIGLHEIELRQHSLYNREFFRNRAKICYKQAYIKAHKCYSNKKNGCRSEYNVLSGSHSFY